MCAFTGTVHGKDKVIILSISGDTRHTDIVIKKKQIENECLSHSHVSYDITLFVIEVLLNVRILSVVFT